MVYKNDKLVIEEYFNGEDPIDFILSKNIITNLGEVWEYSGGSTLLLIGIIEAVSGKKVDTFANEYLFKPLGITDFEWINFPNSENPAEASGLRLNSRDLLKFGMLCQNDDQWKD